MRRVQPNHEIRTDNKFFVEAIQANKTQIVENSLAPNFNDKRIGQSGFEWIFLKFSMKITIL